MQCPPAIGALRNRTIQIYINFDTDIDIDILVYIVVMLAFILSRR